MTSYTRRVSFNNLHPDYIDVDEALPFKQDYLLAFGLQPHAAKHLDVNRLYLSVPMAAIPTGYAPRRRLSRPPDPPPAKSILKNKLLHQQMLFNMENSQSLGINYHSDLNELASHPPTHVPKSELAYTTGGDAVEDSDLDASDSDDDAPTAPPARRKSYSGMTDEELMALDPQYNTGRSNSNVDQFKFDSKTTYYLPPLAPRKASVGGTPGAMAGPKRTVYPSLHENNYKAINLTVMHPEFDAGASRTLMTVILGRKHTWNALDWLFCSGFLHDHDYLVVAALIPAKVIQTQVKKLRKRSSTGSIYNPDTDGFLYQKCQHLLDYIVEAIPSELRVKVTVEFVLDNTVDELPTAPSQALATKKKVVRYKFLLTKLLGQYQPYLMVVGNRLTNLNFKYPVKMGRLGANGTGAGLLTNGAAGGAGGSVGGGGGVGGDSVPQIAVEPPMGPKRGSKDEFLIKLSSYLIKYVPVPVILVGNAARASFAGGLAQRKGSTGSIDSDTLEAAEAVTFGADNAESEVAQEVAQLARSALPMRFHDMVAAVLDASLQEARTYLQQLAASRTTTGSLELEGSMPVKFDLSVITSSKIHSIYSSTRHSLRDEPIYKVKSMISCDEEPPSKRKLEKTRSNALAATVALAGSDKKKPQKKGFWKKIGLKK